MPIPVHLAVETTTTPPRGGRGSVTRSTWGNGASASYTVEYPATLRRQPHSAGSLLDTSARTSWPGSTGPSPPCCKVPAFVCLHHPPVPVGIPFLDGIYLTDAAEFADVIQRHPHVARVLSGHAHRDVSALFACTLMTIAPSTDRQSSVLRLHDACPPGYVADPTSSCCTYSTG